MPRWQETKVVGSFRFSERYMCDLVDPFFGYYDRYFDLSFDQMKSSVRYYGANVDFSDYRLFMDHEDTIPPEIKRRRVFVFPDCEECSVFCGDLVHTDYLRKWNTRFSKGCVLVRFRKPNENDPAFVPPVSPVCYTVDTVQFGDRKCELLAFETPKERYAPVRIREILELGRKLKASMDEDDFQYFADHCDKDGVKRLSVTGNGGRIVQAFAEHYQAVMSATRGGKREDDCECIYVFPLATGGKEAWVKRARWHALIIRKNEYLHWEPEDWHADMVLNKDEWMDNYVLVRFDPSLSSKPNGKRKAQ